jgi:hypothetical protein
MNHLSDENRLMIEQWIDHGPPTFVDELWPAVKDLYYQLCSCEESYHNLCRRVLEIGTASKEQR